MSHRVPACSNCIHGKYHKGSGPTMWSPGEPDEWECTHEKSVDEEFQEKADEVSWEYNKMPDICGVYQPIMIEKCEGCKKDINVPEYQHEIFYTSWRYWDPVPCCSEDCRNALKVMDAMTKPEKIDYY